MALFSDNPFAGVFRAQKQREAEAAMAQQQAMAEQKQQKLEKQLVSQGVPEDKVSSVARVLQGGGVLAVQTGDFSGSRGKNTTYGYGLGGSTPWINKSFQNPQTGKIEQQKVLNPNIYITPDRPYAGPQDKRKPAPRVVGSGMASRQEFRGMVEAKAPTSIDSMGNIVYGEAVKGVNVIEAPEKFVRGKGTSERDRREQFYSEVTGRPMGTLLPLAAYGGFGKDAVDDQGNPLARYSPQIARRRAARGQNPYGPSSTGKLEPAGRGLGPVLPRSQRERQLSGVAEAPSTSMGMAGDPLSFTGFGQKTGMSPQPTASFAKSPFNRNQFGSLAGYGGMPMFPYAGY